MCRLIKLGLLISTVYFSSLDAVAQERRFHIQQLLPLHAVLSDREFANELSLTTSQRAAVEKITSETVRSLSESIRASASIRRQVPKNDKTSAKEAIQQKQSVVSTQRIIAESDVKLSNILTTEQHQRLREIAIQLFEIDAFNDEECIVFMEIAPESREHIQTMIRDINAAAVEHVRLHRAKKLSFADIQKRRAQLRNDGLVKILALLADEQNRRFEELKGKPTSIRAVPNRVSAQPQLMPMPDPIGGENSETERDEKSR